MERIVTLTDFAKALREVAEDAGGEYVMVGGLAVGDGRVRLKWVTALP